MRNSKPERLGGLEIDDEIEFGRLLDRDVGGLRPAQNSRPTRRRAETDQESLLRMTADRPRYLPPWRKRALRDSTRTTNLKILASERASPNRR
jgi:hypothetical protein